MTRHVLTPWPLAGAVLIAAAGIAAADDAWRLEEHLDRCLIYSPGQELMTPAHFLRFDGAAFVSPYHAWARIDPRPAPPNYPSPTVAGQSCPGRIFMHPLSASPVIIEFKVASPGRLSLEAALTDYAAARAADPTEPANGVRLIIRAEITGSAPRVLFDGCIRSNIWQTALCDLSGAASADITVVCDPNGNSNCDHVFMALSGEGAIAARAHAQSSSRFRLPEPAPAQLQLFLRDPFVLAGLVEEWRSLGAAIPPRLQEIEDEILTRLNFPLFFSSGAYRERVHEAARILAQMPAPSGAPLVYGLRGLGGIPAPSIIPVWEPAARLQDQVLATEGKAYPCLLDYDQDGIKDLILGDHSGYITICLNRGTPAAPRYDSMRRLEDRSGRPLRFAPNSKITFADLTGNGLPDLILGSYGGIVRLIPNTGPSGYRFDREQATVLRIQDKRTMNIGYYAYPFAADWNADGLTDLLIGEEGGRVLLLRNLGAKDYAYFAEPETIVDIAPDMYPDPAFADMDGDGLPDLAVGARSGNVYFFRNTGRAGFPRFAERCLLQMDGRPINVGRLSEIFADDWNADGIPDLLAGNADGEVAVFTGAGAVDGAPRFAERIDLHTDELSDLVPKVYAITCPADWDGDGLTDILMGGEGETIRFYRNHGPAGAPRFRDYAILPDVNLRREALQLTAAEKSFWDIAALEFVTEYCGNLSPEAVDWDGDGQMDLLVGHYSGLVYFFRNTGDGAPEGPRLAPPIPLMAAGKILRVAGFATPRAVDFNGDGLPDLLAGDLMGRVHVFRNIGQRDAPRLDAGEMLRIGGRLLDGGARLAVEYGDVNGDGIHDLLCGNKPGEIHALLNTGTNRRPAFAEVEPLRVRVEGRMKSMRAPQFASIRLVDWDHDGAAELMVSDNSHAVWIYKRSQAELNAPAGHQSSNNPGEK